MAKKHPLTRNNSRQRHRDGPCPPDWWFAQTGPPGMMPRLRPPPHRWSNTSTGPTAEPGAGRHLAAPSSGTTAEIGPPQLPRSARRHSARHWRAGPISPAWWDRRAPGTVAPWLPYRAGSLLSCGAIYQFLLMRQPPWSGHGKLPHSPEPLPGKTPCKRWCSGHVAACVTPGTEVPYAVLIVWIYGHSTVADFTPDHEGK